MTSQRKGSFNISFVARRCTILTRFSRPYLGCVAEMAPDDRKVQCTMRLGAWMYQETRRTDLRSSLAFANCSDTCFSEVRLLDTRTPRSFSVSQDSKGISLIV